MALLLNGIIYGSILHSAPFTKYSDLFVKARYFLPYLYLMPPLEIKPFEFYNDV